MSSDDHSLRRRTGKYPAILHFSILAGVLVPFALAPAYLLSRRQTRALHGQIEQLKYLNASLVHEIKVLNQENQTRRDTIRQLFRSAERIETRLSQLEAGQEARSLGHAQAMDGLRAELGELKSRSSAHRASLKSLGTGLADIASLLHENTLKSGDADERIDKLRAAAWKVDRMGDSAEPPQA